VLNRAAEDAVKEASPIFISAVKTLVTFTDAILLGSNNAATLHKTVLLPLWLNSTLLLKLV
jgi:hypothetical protein